MRYVNVRGTVRSRHRSNVFGLEKELSAFQNDTASGA